MTLSASKLKNREEARAFIAALNSQTNCAHCGAQPVEWHNPEHVELDRKRYRISAMVGGGRPLSAIQTELARCTPLCRRCHMKVDGRLQAFRTRGQEVVASLVLPPRPCAGCQRLCKPNARNLCGACYGKEPDQIEATRRRKERGPTTPPRQCDECGQIKQILARGRCATCYERLRYQRVTETGEKAGAVRRREYDAKSKRHRLGEF